MGENATVMALRNEGCTGAVGLVEVPYARAREVVPRDFELVGLAPDAVSANFFAITCARSSNLTHVVENVSYFLTAVVANPVNKTWRQPGAISRYVLDLFVDGGDLTAYLGRWGIGPSQANIDVSALPMGGGPVPAWRVSDASRSFAFEYHPSGIPNLPVDLVEDLWFGRGTYVRVNVSAHYQYHDYQIDGGLLRMEGPSATSQLVGAPAAGWVGQPFFSFSEAWLLHPQRYVGNAR